MRIQSIDAFRVIAILAVISIHSQPFSNTHYFGEIDEFLRVGFNQGARFAVPFFFIATGYFLGKKLEKSNAQATKIIISSLIRLFEIWFFWNLVYIFYTQTNHDVTNASLINTLYGRFSHYFSDSSLEHIIFEGARTSLWFLISLALAIAIIGVFHKAKTKTGMIVLAILLYLMGLLGGSYSHTAFGLNLPFNTRNGPFISTIFVVTGYLLATTQIKSVCLKKSLSLVLFGITLSLLEMCYFMHSGDKAAMSHEYLLGTYFIGLGIFLALLSRPQAVGYFWLPQLGKFTLGVYVSHSLFNWSFWPWRYYYPHPAWEIMYPVIVYLAALILVYLLSKIPLLKKFVI